MGVAVASQRAQGGEGVQERLGIQSGQPHEEDGDGQAMWAASQANAQCVQNPVEENSVVPVRNCR